jgi:(1->4)-alpha-D-glucan 1-alpha-D-glucosylmutase
VEIALKYGTQRRLSFARFERQANGQLKLAAHNRTMTPKNIPITCYRLQFNRNFTFVDAIKILDYLARLGVTTIYSSPILQSRAGSEHGYDVTDPTRIDSELGGEQQFEIFQTELRQRGMSILLDVVPNHMAARPENPWWMDVLENGPGSVYASYFDVDWHPPSRMFENKIVLPILGTFYADVLKERELRLTFKEGRFFVQYYELSFPIAPKSYLDILRHRKEMLEAKLGAKSATLQEYLGIIVGLESLAPRETLPVYAAGERRLQVAALKERLKELYEGDKSFREFLDKNIEHFNGVTGRDGSFRALDQLLSEQSYALSYWNSANAEINYRRFFNIGELIGVRVEDPAVMDATHVTVFRLLDSGAVTGLRIDHIDGLRDPLGYLQRLQGHTDEPEEGKRESSERYIVVEKILCGTEAIPQEWPVSGTTGYEFLNAVNRIFVYPQGAQKMARSYSTIVRRDERFEDMVYAKKKLIMTSLLAVEMRYLSHQLSILAQQDRHARELPSGELAHAFSETTASLPVYRTYIRGMDLPDHAAHYIGLALTEARSRNPQIDAKCFAFVRDVLLGSEADTVLTGQRESRLAFVMRWQQLTGAIMAKGFEDTLLYVYFPLVSLNDVGGDPRPSPESARDFGDFISDRLRRSPFGLNSTATHDTKRGEDVRARINVLSELPDEWHKHLRRWFKWNRGKTRQLSGQTAPDRNEEIFIYQTLLGAWPLKQSELPEFRNRMRAYVLKAAREAKVHTRWVRQNPKQEKALQNFVTAITKTKKQNVFLADLRRFQQKIAYFGMLNGLAQTLIKITSPGVPEIYQGCDLWDLRLVDPDNRRAVDYSIRAKLLAEIERRSQSHGDVDEFRKDIVTHWQDGRIKLYIIWSVLNFRRQHPMLFQEGSFEPLKIEGKRANNLIAYARRSAKSGLIVVAPKWLAQAKAPMNQHSMRRFWGNTEIRLPAGGSAECVNLFGDTVPSLKVAGNRSALKVAELLGDFPVACLFNAPHANEPPN